MIPRRLRVAAFKARRAWGIMRGAFIASRAMFRMIDLVEGGELERREGEDLDRVLAMFGTRRMRVGGHADGRNPNPKHPFFRPETDEEARKRLRQMFSRNERRMTHDRKPKP